MVEGEGGGLTAPGRRPRIGYSTLGRDLSRPGDRRRFCHYAASRDLAFEIAEPGRDYDLVVTTSVGDLSAWIRLPRSTKLVLDLVDSYLVVPRTDPKAVVRGLAKFLLRHTRHLHLDYRALLVAACRRADAVVCATPEQREAVLPLCPNVHVALDFQPEAERKVKTDYTRGEVFNLVWEGLPENVVTFRCFSGAWRELRRRRKVALHLVTDLEVAMGSTMIWKRPTLRTVRRLLGREGVYLYQWNQEMLARLCTACDLAVIPMPLEDPFRAGKPENKLVFFWRMGVPTVTSATPAYLRAMREAGLDMTCRSEDEWVRTLERLMDDEEARRSAGRRGREHVTTAFAEERLLAKWDGVFASLR